RATPAAGGRRSDRPPPAAPRAGAAWWDLSIGLGLCRRDGPIEGLALLAALRAEADQHGKLLLRLRQLAGLHVQLSQVLVRALVIGVEIERLLVEGQRPGVIAGLAQREAEQIVDIGVLHIPVDLAVEMRQRGLEIL